jgi:hypothetical protein
MRVCPTGQHFEWVHPGLFQGIPGTVSSRIMTLSELQNETDTHLRSLKLQNIRNKVRDEEGSGGVQLRHWAHSYAVRRYLTDCIGPCLH